MILTVISLIFTILTYLGVVRYCKIKYGDNCKCVSESYLKLPRVESKNKVVVSMYTEQKDISNNTTLKSILDQTVHPDQIIIVTDKDTVIPDFLKKDSIVLKQSAGSLGKTAAFLTPLQTQKNAGTKIIIVTDGVVYGTDFIETIVEASDNNPDAVIFVEGYNSKKYVSGVVDKTTPDIINIPAGVLIQPSFFKQYVDPGKSKVLANSPNAVLSALIAKNKVATKSIKYRETFHSGHVFSRDEKLAIEYFAEYYKLV